MIGTTDNTASELERLLSPAQAHHLANHTFAGLQTNGNCGSVRFSQPLSYTSQIQLLLNLGAGQHRPGPGRRVLLSSRRPPTRRVMLNEDEVVQFMKDRHDPFPCLMSARHEAMRA